MAKVVVARLCLTLAKERLVPFETARHIAHADDRPYAFHNIYDNKLIREKKKKACGDYLS